MKKVINTGKRNKTMNEIKRDKNINKNPQSFLDISPFSEINNPFGIIWYSLQTYKNTVVK